MIKLHDFLAERNIPQKSYGRGEGDRQEKMPFWFLMTRFKRNPTQMRMRSYDHSKGEAVQGFNHVNCLYQVDEISIPVAFELIRKPNVSCGLKTWTGQKRRCS